MDEATIGSKFYLKDNPSLVRLTQTTSSSGSQEVDEQHLGT
jgi:hypothetical protein